LESLTFLKIQHNKSCNLIKSYVIPQSPNGFAGRCFLALCRESGIKPLTCTIFDPVVYARFVEEQAVFSTDLPSAKRAAQRLYNRRCRWAGYFLPLAIKTRHMATRCLTAASFFLCRYRGVKICNIRVTQHQLTNFDNRRIICGRRGFKGVKP